MAILKIEMEFIRKSVAEPSFLTSGSFFFKFVAISNKFSQLTIKEIQFDIYFLSGQTQTETS